jgi:two-component system, response regulator PdtaR
MESARILIAMNNDASINKLKAILIENGYTVVDQARDGNECLRKIRALRPDITLLDHSLPLLNGFEVAKVSSEDKICDIILIATEEQKGLIGEIKSETGFVCMSKPLNRPSLINTIDLMVKNARKIRELEKEIEGLKATIDTRKEVEKAKGLLMKNLSLSESEAFKRIQKQSMDKGIPMREIAKAIILAYDI